MAQSLAQLTVHIVFSTKDRMPFLANPAFRQRLHSYITGICKKKDSPCLQIGGVADHVHLLCALSRSIAVADLIREIKRSSTNWVRDEDASLRQFSWQAGYGVFAVSHLHVADVTHYIRTQEEHHLKVSFQTELRRILRKNGVAFDERYLWD